MEYHLQQGVMEAEQKQSCPLWIEQPVLQRERALFTQRGVVMNRRALRNRRIRGRMYGGVEGGVSNGAPYPI